MSKTMIKAIYRKFKKYYQRFVRLESVFYAGTKYTCPVCEGHFNSFKTYRGNSFIKGVKVDHTTKNYTCPKCGSGIRHRLVMGFLKSNVQLVTGKKNVLHFAPEEFITDYFNKFNNINYIKADIDPSKYKNAIELDITNIKLNDNSVDGIICIHVLEHIEDDLKAISELSRILVSGGWLLLALPIYGNQTFELKNLTAKEREFQYGIDQHMRLNGLDLQNKLEKAGFKVQIISTGDLPGSYFDLTLNTPHSESDKYLFFCSKA